MRINSQKGITLMVLVITIVVMLIIAGASASVLFDGEGLLKTSEESKILQENYANSEETKTNDLINDVTSIMSGANGKTEDEKPTQQEPEQKEYVFDYTGAVQEWTVPVSGVWKLEVWGAQGGNAKASDVLGYGANGGYSKGNVRLEKDTIIYIYAGGAGVSEIITKNLNQGGGFNGGGHGSGQSAKYSGSGGGGATDIRIKQDSIYARIIVAGGGGGYCSGKAISEKNNTGFGGGTNGGVGLIGSTSANAGGGTISMGGSPINWNDQGVSASSGTFGQGGSITANNSGGGTGGGRRLVWRRSCGLEWSEVVAQAGFIRQTPLIPGNQETQQMQQTGN